MSAWVDPHMAAILAEMRSKPAVDLRAMPMAEARATFTAQQVPWVWSPRPMAEERDLTIPVAGGAMNARLFRSDLTQRSPVIIFAHGGGWTFGNIETHCGTMRTLALQSGCAVLGVDYRLAPEHPFPTPTNDIVAALDFVRKGGLGDACDPGRVALAGDSAGANIALGALVALRDRGEAMPATAALFYGCYAPDFDTASHKRFGAGSYVLATAGMRWYWANFLGATAMESAPPAAAPLRADLSGLPPLYLNAAGLDPLLDDTTQLVARLSDAGVRHRFDLWPGVIHGFMRLARELPAAREAIAAAAAHLKTHLVEN
jgi:acetyl esterase